jgi:hypothetical protein
MCGGLQAAIRGLTQGAGCAVVAVRGRDARERIQGEDLDGGIVGVPGLLQDRQQTLLRTLHLICSVDGGQQAFAEQGLFPAARLPVPGGCRFEGRSRRSGLAERAQGPAQVHPGQRRKPDVAGGVGPLDRELQGCRADRVVTRLALRTSQTHDLVGLGLLEAERSRAFRCAADVHDGLVEPPLQPGQLAEHRLAAHVQPRVGDLA